MRYSQLRMPLLGLILVSTTAVALFAVGCLPIGPVGLISGGQLRGIVHEGPEPNWSEWQNVRIVELQVDPESPRSVNVGFFVDDGQPFVSATLRPDEKRWPRAISNDPHVVLRIEGKLYPRLAQRVVDEHLRVRLLEAGRRKFDPSYFETDRTWFFKLRPVTSR